MRGFASDLEGESLSCRASGHGACESITLGVLAGVCGLSTLWMAVMTLQTGRRGDDTDTEVDELEYAHTFLRVVKVGVICHYPALPCPTSA